MSLLEQLNAGLRGQPAEAPEVSLESLTSRIGGVAPTRPPREEPQTRAANPNSGHKPGDFFKAVASSENTTLHVRCLPAPGCAGPLLRRGNPSPPHPAERPPTAPSPATPGPRPTPSSPGSLHTAASLDRRELPLLPEREAHRRLLRALQVAKIQAMYRGRKDREYISKVTTFGCPPGRPLRPPRRSPPSSSPPFFRSFGPSSRQP